jgi:hypothetical protein
MPVISEPPTDYRVVLWKKKSLGLPTGASESLVNSFLVSLSK